jgi:hypothetical protein
VESIKSKIAVNPENSRLDVLITAVYYFDIFRLKMPYTVAVNQRRKARQKPVDRNAGPSPPTSSIGHGFNKIAAESVVVTWLCSAAFTIRLTPRTHVHYYNWRGTIIKNHIVLYYSLCVPTSLHYY